jgi:hypothetical protein
LTLFASGQVVPLSQIATTFCICREAINLPPQTAEIVAEIDDNRHVQRVFLPDGMSADSPKTTIQLVGD